MRSIDGVLTQGHSPVDLDDEDDDCNDDKEDVDEVPEQLVVDYNGVDKVESKEPEEEARDPAGQLRMILMFGNRFN